MFSPLWFILTGNGHTTHRECTSSLGMHILTRNAHSLCRVLLNRSTSWIVQRRPTETIQNVEPSIQLGSFAVKCSKRFEVSLKVGSHDPIFGASHYSDSKKLVTRINISMSWNNVRKIIGSKKWIVWADAKFFKISSLHTWNVGCIQSFFTIRKEELKETFLLCFKGA